MDEEELIEEQEDENGKVTPKINKKEITRMSYDTIVKTIGEYVVTIYSQQSSPDA